MFYCKCRSWTCYNSDFLRQHNKWGEIDPVQLYDVPIVKLEAMRKIKMPQLIQK